VTTKTKIAHVAALSLASLLLCMVAVSRDASGQNQTHESQPAKNTSNNVPERLEIAGIENTFRLSPRLYSGGDPHGAKALTALKLLGVKTIVSVDGATPDVETAGTLGLRYVHLPIGYDGVPREKAVRMIKAITTLPGPVYLHCHHGKHRGPSAAAVCALASEGWTKDQAIRWMELAGTSPDYRGLFASVRGFVAPSYDELERAGNEFPERTKAADLVELMVQVDARWDRLKAVQKFGFKAPPSQPDLDPPHEGLQLVEQFQEIAGLREAKARGADFLAATEAAREHAANLENLLRDFGKNPIAEVRKKLEAAFLAAGKSCTACHARHRDQ
jgi:protein tyrosine phosphatase (PTP) superfamily phosphohydrolase (DUF442 family)